MPRVYAREKGGEVRIGNHGTATHDRPAFVPVEVAAELAGLDGLRIEPDEGVIPGPAGSGSGRKSRSSHGAAGAREE